MNIIPWVKPVKEETISLKTHENLFIKALDSLLYKKQASDVYGSMLIYQNCQDDSFRHLMRIKIEEIKSQMNKKESYIRSLQGMIQKYKAIHEGMLLKNYNISSIREVVQKNRGYQLFMKVGMISRKDEAKEMQNWELDTTLKGLFIDYNRTKIKYDSIIKAMQSYRKSTDPKFTNYLNDPYNEFQPNQLGMLTSFDGQISRKLIGRISDALHFQTQKSTFEIILDALDDIEKANNQLQIQLKIATHRQKTSKYKIFDKIIQNAKQRIKLEQTINKLHLCLSSDIISLQDKVLCQELDCDIDFKPLIREFCKQAIQRLIEVKKCQRVLGLYGIRLDANQLESVFLYFQNLSQNVGKALEEVLEGQGKMGEIDFMVADKPPSQNSHLKIFQLSSQFLKLITIIKPQKSSQPEPLPIAQKNSLSSCPSQKQIPTSPQCKFCENIKQQLQRKYKRQEYLNNSLAKLSIDIRKMNNQIKSLKEEKEMKEGKEKLEKLGEAKLQRECQKQEVNQDRGDRKLNEDQLRSFKSDDEDEDEETIAKRKEVEDFEKQQMRTLIKNLEQNLLQVNQQLEQKKKQNQSLQQQLHILTQKNQHLTSQNLKLQQSQTTLTLQIQQLTNHQQQKTALQQNSHTALSNLQISFTQIQRQQQIKQEEWERRIIQLKQKFEDEVCYLRKIIQREYYQMGREMERLVQVEGELRGKVGELRGEVGELRGEVGELSGKVGELEGELANARGQLEIAQGLLRNAEDQLNIYKQKVEKSSQIESDYEFQIKQLKQDITNLKSIQTSLTLQLKTSHLSHILHSDILPSPPPMALQPLLTTLLQTIQSTTSLQIKSSTLQYKLDHRNNADPHQYIDNIPHWLAIFQTVTGFIVGVYCPAVYGPDRVERAGFLWSYGVAAGKWRIYRVGKLDKARVYTYDKNYFIVGNSELRYKFKQKYIENCFVSNYKYFDTGKDKTQDFYGIKAQKIDIRNFQFHTIQFNE